MSAQLLAWGRSPDACKVLFCVSVVLGETVKEAAERKRRRRARLAAALSFFSPRDLSRLPTDEPVQRAETNASRTMVEAYTACGRVPALQRRGQARRAYAHPTLRETLMEL